MSTTFTPGPWFIWQELAMQREGCEPDEIADELLYEDEYGIYAGSPTECTRGVLRGHSAHICDIDSGRFDFDDDEDAAKARALANARLIAALPDLYDAAKEALDYLESWKDLSGGKAYRMLEAALAKAQVQP